MTEKNILKLPSIIVTDNDFDVAFVTTMEAYCGVFGNQFSDEIARALGYFEAALKDKYSHKQAFEKIG